MFTSQKNRVFVCSVYTINGKEAKLQGADIYRRVALPLDTCALMRDVTLALTVTLYIECTTIRARATNKR